MKAKQSNSDTDLSLYISLLSTFYDKVTESHSKRSHLRRNWQTFKYHLSMMEAENRLKERSVTPTKRSSNTTQQVESRQEMLARLGQIYPQYKIFLFKTENTFYMILGLSYIYYLVAGRFKEAVERLQTEIKGSKSLGGESTQHEFLVRKLDVLFEYLLKTMQGNRESQLLVRLESFCAEESALLGKAIKIVLNVRNPVLMSATTLSVEQPGNNELKTICSSLDMALTVLSQDEQGNVQQNIVSKRGKYHILLGYDAATEYYFQMEPQAIVQESSGGNKQQGLNALLKLFASDGDSLRKLRCAQKIDSNKNEVIRQRVKGLRGVK